MKKGLILTNAYCRMQSALNQPRRLKEELELLGVTMDIVPNNEFLCHISKSNIVSKANYDFCIYLDKDKYMSEMLEKSGLRLFNSHQAVLDCDDKMCTYIKLADKDIPIVDTMAGLLCYSENEEIQTNTIDIIEKRFGFPVIVKECYGSLGKGVYKCDSRAELVSVMQKLKMVPHLFQRFVATSEGRDVRVIVVGDRVVACMLRESNVDFRSNIELGGVGTSITATDEIKKICERVTRVLKLDYAGIDLLFDGDRFVVCEVNSNAFFGGIEKVTKVNVAKAYAEHIYNEVYAKNDLDILLSNVNRISITNVAVDRCNKNLGVNLKDSQHIFNCIDKLNDAHIYKNGKNWHIEKGDVRYLVNGSTYMIITANKITK